MAYHKISSAQTDHKSIHGINLTLFDGNNPAMSVVTVETEAGHFQEFRMKSIAFTYLILDGFGTFVLDDEKVAVEKGDLLEIKAGTRIHYFGKLRMVLICTPAFFAEDEEHIRFVDKSESPYFPHEKENA